MRVLKSLEAIFAICCISGLFSEGGEIGRALFSDQSMLWLSEHGNPDRCQWQKKECTSSATRCDSLLQARKSSMNEHR